MEEGCRCTLQMTTNCPPGEIEAEHPLVKAMMSAVSPGEPERAALKPFLASCEMAMLMEGLGIPALIFGPGSIRQAHITNEYVELDQLARAPKSSPGWPWSIWVPHRRIVMGNYSLVCRSCGERCEGDAYRCPSCGGILNTEYPFDRAGRALLRPAKRPAVLGLRTLLPHWPGV